VQGLHLDVLAPTNQDAALPEVELAAVRPIDGVERDDGGARLAASANCTRRRSPCGHRTDVTALSAAPDCHAVLLEPWTTEGTRAKDTPMRSGVADVRCSPPRAP
jgi:hypothetical protein